MLQLRKGNTVPFPEKLSEGYVYKKPCFTANVGADKIKMMLAHFIMLHNEPIFFILELPTKKRETEIADGKVASFHRDVYYMDECTQQEALAVLSKTAALLINDGLCTFGFGCHNSQDEIVVAKYNVVTIYCSDKAMYDGFFEEHHIFEVEQLLTADATFTEQYYGEAVGVETNGKTVYDIPDMFKSWGMYLAEHREG